MPRQPSRIQTAAYGTDSTASATPSYLNREIPRPAQLSRGPSQGLEQFGAGIDPNVARALNQIQSNVKSAVSVAKNNPMGDGNLIENVTFTGDLTTITIVKHGLGAAPRGFTLQSHNDSGYALLTQQAQVPASLDETQIAFIALSSAGVAFQGTVWVYR